MRIHDGQAAKERKKRATTAKDNERDASALEAYEVEKQCCQDARNPKRDSAESSGPSIEIDLTNPAAASAITASTGPLTTVAAATKRTAATSIFASLVSTVSKRNPSAPFKKVLLKAELALNLAIQKLCTVYTISSTMPRFDPFQQVLQLARQTSSSYEPPTKQEMHGPLLEANYVAHQGESLSLYPLLQPCII